MELQKFYSKLERIYKKFIKTSIWYKLIIILALILISNYMLKHSYNKLEGFKNSEGQKEKFKENSEVEDIYDKEYSELYDDLVLNGIKIDYELGKILEIMGNKNKKLLDVGCGTGEHIGKLSNMNIECTGLDLSKHMIEKAKNKFSKPTYDVGDVDNSMRYVESSFDGILCTYFTIYYIKNKRQFFDNTYKWLKPGGYLFLHLVDRENFDTLMNISNPISLVNIQDYVKDRITSSVAEFNDFSYKAKFNLNGRNTTFEETFKFKSGNVRKNVHNLDMESQKEIISYAKESGYSLHKTIDLGNTKYKNEYLYVLQKKH
jgi:ubiquinone/menaquinone biosynthesis C-methylase UbiE